MFEEDEEEYRYNICRFCEKNFEFDKVRDHCHLTGKFRGTAHNKCNIIVTQKQSNLFYLFFTISVIMIVIYSSESQLIKDLTK